MKMKNRSPKHTLAAVIGILDSVVEDKCRITYGYLAEHLGMHPHSTALWELLNEVVDLDHRAGQPYRSVLVVNANTHAPGKLFIEKVKSLGYNIDDAELFCEAQRTALGQPLFTPVLTPIY